ncbi:hypothetical protein HYH03_011040 [Edaphochlamys debaryana]|uniref:Signal peptide peptidase n=1 Tax=Edaphochlamys debaryana TaxID=47281 RepID=A0A835XVN2_9CHLO|nr:hypothetical protein HYH03_011040 [Edaphochlamys debaryana]|eukprot:KAG2490650.1 hypothetical protein HYH03_011040 [Edaphochlamys debaryana]
MPLASWSPRRSSACPARTSRAARVGVLRSTGEQKPEVVVVSTASVDTPNAESPLGLDDPALAPGPGPSSSSSSSSAAAKPWKWEESWDAVTAYGALASILALGTADFLHTSKAADLPYFVGIAVCTIYVGAHRALTTSQRQQITLKEGILAPVLASVSLFSIYLLIKFIPDFDIKTFLNAYFWLLGSFAISGAAVPVLRKIGGPLGELSIRFPLPEGFLLDEAGASIRQAELAPTDLVAVATALGLASFELASGHSNFTLNNLVAALIATDILQLIGPRSFRTAGLLLMGLLVYDVFWVFGSPKVVGDNVMLTVATSDLITGPTRILFPRIAGGGSTMEAAAASFPFSLLGLGDIAIPGLLACLALRYDASRSVDMKARALAAAEAMEEAIAGLQPGATGLQVANATADAAFAAYDRVADRELRQRDRAVDGVDREGGRAAAAASSLGQAFVRGVSAAAGGATGGSAALGGSRDSLSAGSPSGRLGAALASVGDEGGKAGEEEARRQREEEEQEAKEAYVPVSEAALNNRTYFSAVMVSYVLGLVGAFVANDITGLGQPALLYIVPCTLGAVALTAAQRGELERIWNFTDRPSFGVPSREGADANKNQH